MKIGLFVTGHFRDAARTRENYSQFLDGHDVSVYLGTWSSRNIDRCTFVPDLTPINAEEKARSIFGDTLKGLWIGDMNDFLNGRPPAPNCSPRIMWNDYISPENDPLQARYPAQQRVLDQWYGVFQTYLLGEDTYDSFDVVIRIRSDMIFAGKPKIPFEDIREGIHVNGYTWWHNPEDRENGVLADSTKLVPFALSDQLAWGKPYWMRKYFEHYFNFAKFFAGRANVWHGLPREHFEIPNSFLFNAEHMMAYYLLKYPYYHYSDEIDMPWHRHGHNDNPTNRFDSDYYCWGF